MLLNKRPPYKFLFSKVKNEFIFVTIYSIILGIAHNYFGLEITIPLAIPSILGTAISLILAFRTKQSYDRWWEGRKLWGSLVNNSRNLALKLAVILEEEQNYFFLPTLPA